MTLRIEKRSSLSVASLARCGEGVRAGMAIAARMPMMVMTTRSSSSVNPRARRFLLGLPITSHHSPIFIERAVDRLQRREAVDVVDVLASPGGGVGLVLKRAQTPLGLLGHRIDRYPSKKL